MRSSFSRGLLLACSVLVIAIATLWPAVGQPAAVWFGCLICGDHGTADLLLNVILFVPLGAALALFANRIARAAVIGALLSAIIEVAQLYIPGRDFSLGDVVVDTAGVALGALLARTAQNWLTPPPLAASRLSRGAGALAAGLCLLTGFLLTPALPISQYYGLWTPFFGHLQLYRGRVLGSRIDTQPIIPGPIVNSLGIRGRLLADTGFTLRVRAIVGPRPSALAPLVGLYDNHRREIVLVGIDRDDVTLRLRTQAAAWRLDRPDIRLVGGMELHQAGDTIDITAARGHRGELSITAGVQGKGDLGFTVGSGWALLLYPETLPAWVKAAAGFAWVGLLFVPAGFWMRSRADALWTAGAAVAGLLGAPALTLLAPTPALQWAAALIGLVAGAGLHVVTASTNVLTQRSIRE